MRVPFSTPSYLVIASLDLEFRHDETRGTICHERAMSEKAAATESEANIGNILERCLEAFISFSIGITKLAKHARPLRRIERYRQRHLAGFQLKFDRITKPTIELLGSITGHVIATTLKIQMRCRRSWAGVGRLFGKVEQRATRSRDFNCGSDLAARVARDFSSD